MTSQIVSGISGRQVKQAISTIFRQNSAGESAAKKSAKASDGSDEGGKKERRKRVTRMQQRIGRGSTVLTGTGGTLG